MAHSNAELFLTKQDKRAVKSVLLRHWHLLCTSVVKMHCSRPTVLGLKSDAKENNMHVHGNGVDCYQRHALQHSSFAAPPGSCDLLSTVQVQPVRATTHLP